MPSAPTGSCCQLLPTGESLALSLLHLKLSTIPPTFGIPGGSVQEELLECAQLLMSPENPGNTPVSQGTGLLQEGCLQAQVPLKRSLRKGQKAAAGQGNLGTCPGYPCKPQGSAASPEPTGWQGTIPGTGKGCQPQTHTAQCPAPRQGKIS